MKGNQCTLLQAGTYVVMQKMHVLALRTMLKRLHECQVQERPESSQINLNIAQAVLKRCGMDLEMDEVAHRGCAECTVHMHASRSAVWWLQRHLQPAASMRLAL
jgi:hypothetical protein